MILSDERSGQKREREREREGRAPRSEMPEKASAAADGSSSSPSAAKKVKKTAAGVRMGVAEIVGASKHKCCFCHTVGAALHCAELGTCGIFVIFSIIKNYFFCIFYQVEITYFWYQSYLKSPLPVKLT